MKDLTLRYYDTEMRYLRDAAKEFAATHPDRAAMLNLDRAGAPDPFVERLLEGFAFSVGRLRQKIDDDLPELTEGLVSILWPHYLRTIPSLSVVALTPDLPKMKMAEVAPAGLEVYSRPVGPKDTHAEVKHWEPRRIEQRNALAMSVRKPVSMKNRPVMGTHATDVNGQVLIRLFTCNPDEVSGWLPGGQLHGDFMAMLHVYLGAKLDARLELCVERQFLPDAQLNCRRSDAVQLGRTAVLPQLSASPSIKNNVITIQLGRYERVRVNTSRIETDEEGDYRW